MNPPFDSSSLMWEFQEPRTKEAPGWGARISQSQFMPIVLAELLTVPPFTLRSVPTWAINWPSWPFHPWECSGHQCPLGNEVVVLHSLLLVFFWSCVGTKALGCPAKGPLGTEASISKKGSSNSIY